VTALAPDASLVHVQLDGSLKAPLEYSQETIIGGDALVPLISLASIAAKVERDRLMCKLSEEYPQYGFEIHKGYGTKMHYEALGEYGLCAIHRRSFIHID
jgi:ribonuclease HII